jgi:uncharacterized cofD-like protein
MTHLTGDFAQAVKLSAEVLNVAGRIYPATGSNVVLEATLADGRKVRGETRISRTTAPIQKIELRPRAPKPLPEALNAIAHADLITLGPGSLFTSVMPHLLAPRMAEAIIAAAARRILVLNIAAQPGETTGFAPHTHLEEIARLVPALRLDAVIADPRVVPDLGSLRDASDALVAALILAPVAVSGKPHHDPVTLAAAFRRVMTELVAEG